MIVLCKSGLIPRDIKLRFQCARTCMLQGVRLIRVPAVSLIGKTCRGCHGRRSLKIIIATHVWAVWICISRTLNDRSRSSLIVKTNYVSFKLKLASFLYCHWQDYRKLYRILIVIFDRWLYPSPIRQFLYIGTVNINFNSGCIKLTYDSLRPRFHCAIYCLQLWRHMK